jgi:hypothetical protein
METSQSVGRSPPCLTARGCSNMGLIIGRSPACDNPRPNARRLEIDVALIDEDQHAQDGDIEAEGGFLSISGRRLPHGEPLAGNHHEAEEPDEEGEKASGDDVSLARVELGRLRVA